MQKPSPKVTAAPLLNQIVATVQNNQSSDCLSNTTRDRVATIEPVKTLRPKEAAALIGMDAKTLANWRWRGSGPSFFKLPGRSGKGAVRYDRETVLRWLDDHARKSTSDDGKDRRPS